MSDRLFVKKAFYISFPLSLNVSQAFIPYNDNILRAARNKLPAMQHSSSSSSLGWLNNA